MASRQCCGTSYADDRDPAPGSGRGDAGGIVRGTPAGGCFCRPLYVLAQTESLEREIMPATVRSLEIASVLGVDTVIVHPLHPGGNHQIPEEAWSVNLKFYEALLPHAQKFRLRICRENLFLPGDRGGALPDIFSDAERTCRFLDMFRDSHLVACVDVGHACLLGDRPGEIIRALGHDRLHAVHIHDNDAMSDTHTLPYLGKTDWEDVTQALADIDYDGVLTLESFQFYSHFPDDYLQTAAKWQHDMAEYLANKVEHKRI